MKKYRVTLSKEERATLLAMISKGKASAKKLLYARILLQADQSDDGPRWLDKCISGNIKLFSEKFSKCIILQYDMLIVLNFI